MSEPLQTFGFFVFDGISLLSFASAIEPLRLANWVSGRPLYSWALISADGEPVSASNGVRMVVDYSVAYCKSPSPLFVCSGMNADRVHESRVLSWLRRLRREGVQVGSIGSGAYIIAAAGLLYDHRCTTHWEEKERLSDIYPTLSVTDGLFEIDRGVPTCAGGTAAIDLMLHLIAGHHGREFAGTIAEEFLQQGVRPGAAHQRLEPEQRLGVDDHRLAEAVRLMETHIEDAISLEQICQAVGVSLRHLNRLFTEKIGSPPHRYYMALRLRHAHQLIKQTGAMASRAAVEAGFVSASHFARSYKKHFGTSPSTDRRKG